MNVNYIDQKLSKVHWHQCDQIGRFIELWATFLSLWKQLFCPDYHIFRQFVKGVKIFHFSSEISFGPLFIDIWRLFSGHTDYKSVISFSFCPTSKGGKSFKNKRPNWNDDKDRLDQRNKDRQENGQWLWKVDSAVVSDTRGLEFESPT